MAIVIIDGDPLSLGTAATEADLEVFSDNLIAHLTEHFPGKDFVIRKEVGATSRCIDDDEVNSHVRELMTGDGWIGLLG